MKNGMKAFKITSNNQFLINMRLTANILHIPKLHKLIDEYDLLKLCLTEDSYGGWIISASSEQLIELERLLIKNGIKYKIK